MYGPDVAIVFHPQFGPVWMGVASDVDTLKFPRRWPISIAHSIGPREPPRAIDYDVLDEHVFRRTLMEKVRVFIPANGEGLTGTRIEVVERTIETREWRTCPICEGGFDAQKSDVQPYLSKRSEFDVRLWEIGEVRCNRTAWNHAVADRMRDALAFAAKCEPDQICDYASCKSAAIVPVFAETVDEVRMVAELEGWDVRRYNEDKRIALLVRR